MRVALVATWDTACGIAEHAALLKEHVERADQTIELVPLPEALDPAALRGSPVDAYDLVYLDYHAALHSRWTPEVITEFQDHGGIRVVATYHDTGVPNSAQCLGILQAVDAAVIHEEPFEAIPEQIHVWRMGVPDWQYPWVYDRSTASWCGPRPILGTVGFPFPWKNYDELCRITAQVGWALLLIAPNCSAADIMRWEALNPHIRIEGFLPRHQVVQYLMGCDATAFLYTCANTGQSGAVLQGIAARKPVLALSSCRQFRSLFEDPLGRTAITWCETFQDVTFNLSHFTRIERVHAPIVALAEQESWTKLGRKYAALFHGVAGA